MSKTACKKCKFFSIKNGHYDYSKCPGLKPGAIRFMDESLENDYECPYYEMRFKNKKDQFLNSINLEQRLKKKTR